MVIFHSYGTVYQRVWFIWIVLEVWSWENIGKYGEDRSPIFNHEILRDPIWKTKPHMKTGSLGGTCRLPKK